VTEQNLECARCKKQLNKEIVETTFLGVCPSCILEESETVPIPKTLGSVELLDLIGEGGMGLVYRARHTKLDRTVAVKILSWQASNDPEFVLRFEREAKILAQLDHPNIVTVHDFGQQEEFSYIVMEYVNGTSLYNMLKSGPLARKQAIEIAIQVCNALAAAHKSGIVHRDIKPANIMIDQGNKVKVADFGISTLVQEDTRITLTGYAVGTPMYAAPEQFSGMAYNDPKIDIYSLGVVLYEMLTGELPVGKWVSVGTDLDPILRNALSRNPDDRYQNVDEFRNDLARLLTHPEKFQPVTSHLAEESIWIYAEAFLCTIAAATFFWNILTSITPKIFEQGGIIPTTTFIKETLSDGRIVSYVRFELWPTLLMLLCAGAMLAGYGLLVRFWQKSAPPHEQKPLTIHKYSWATLILGGIIIIAWLFHKVVNNELVNKIMPLLGGILLVIMLYIFCVGVLKNQRRGRRLIQEIPLWFGFLISLIPPSYENLAFVINWQPLIR